MVNDLDLVSFLLKLIKELRLIITMILIVRISQLLASAAAFKDKFTIYTEYQGGKKSKAAILT